MEIGSHRRRSNTAQRLDQMRKDRLIQQQIVVVQWKDVKDSVKFTSMYHEVIIYYGDPLEPDVTRNH